MDQDRLQNASLIVSLLTVSLIYGILLEFVLQTFYFYRAVTLIEIPTFTTFAHFTLAIGNYWRLDYYHCGALLVAIGPSFAVLWGLPTMFSLIHPIIWKLAPRSAIKSGLLAVFLAIWLLGYGFLCLLISWLPGGKQYLFTFALLMGTAIILIIAAFFARTLHLCRVRPSMGIILLLPLQVAQFLVAAFLMGLTAPVCY